MIQEKIDADVEAVSAGLMKELKMNGLVQADPELVYRMDSSLGSIPVAFNKDGSFRKILLWQTEHSLQCLDGM